ncbi:hypothetical protein [Thiohalophilus sp.]|uniref:hypothetical protein n=1 Tax=Thiohalophilus sp. TaxID=3028392 RepID=UPI002ACD4335|nr:hypothetical protein [Thiohalophilus sp.]MDZ7803161.1 hypothetical protein [Thiohalophilus sp.]
MIALFRNLIIFSYVVYAVFFFMPYFEMYLYEKEVLDALSWSGYGAIVSSNQIVSYIFFLGYTISLLGLFYFKSWARTLFIILTTLSVILTALSGVSVLPGVEGALLNMTILADGATIAIMYFTSISAKFSR